MARILVVDDEKMIRSIVRKYAEHDGHIVEEAVDGKEAVELCRTQAFDVVLMDVMMPGVDGIAALKEIRRFSDVPFIMVSAREEEYIRVTAFEAGAEDYVVKPFLPRELMMRIRVVTSRYARMKKLEALSREVLSMAGSGSAETKIGTHEMFLYKGLTVDMSARTVFVDGVQKELTYKAYEILLLFIRNNGIALSREKILTEVWGYDFGGDDRTLDTHIKLLRTQLGVYRKLIVTMRGVGYRFEAK